MRYGNGERYTDLEQVKDDLLLYIVIYFVDAAIIGGLTFLMRQLIIVVSRLFEYDLKNISIQQYQRLSLSFYKQIELVI